MSLSERDARAFLEPLKGKTVTLLINDRKTNLALLRCISSLTSTAACGCVVFDVDAFYSSNSDKIHPSAANSTYVYVPEPGSSIEMEFPMLFKTESEVFVIESLNTLYNLFASSSVSSKSRKLAFALASLSFLAKTNDKTGLLIMYRREKLMKTGGGSISDLSDMTVSVKTVGSEMRMECERGMAWPEGRFSLTLP